MQKKVIIYNAVLKPPSRTPSPTDGTKDDTWLWETVAPVLDEVDSLKLRYSGLIVSEQEDSLLRKVKVTTDKKGRKGIWVTLHGRRIFIPLSKVAKYSSLALAVPAALTGALLATAGGRALSKALLFKAGTSSEAYVARRGLFYALRHPRTTLSAVRIANRMDNPMITYYGLPKGIKPDPEYLLFDGFTITGKMKGVAKSEFTVTVSAAAKDMLEVNLIKVEKKQVSGLHVMKELVLTAQSAKKQKVLFQANIVEGSYMWARMGANWVETPLTKKARRTIARRLRNYLPEFSRRIVRERIKPHEIYKYVSRELGPQRAKKVFLKTHWDGVIDFNDPVVRNYAARLIK